MNRTGRPLVPVWDPLIRVGHWVLVAAFAVAYLTEEDLLSAHVWVGYVGIVVAVRILWGFSGPRYARFSDFVRGPREAFTYLHDLLFSGRGDISAIVPAAERWWSLRSCCSSQQPL